jgi:hypothetical protein
MDAIEKAEELLLRTRKTPKMFAATREAMMSRVTSILEMSDIMMDYSYFYEVHLGTQGAAYATITEPVTDDWAHTVIDDALIKLKGTRWKD